MYDTYISNNVLYCSYFALLCLFVKLLFDYWLYIFNLTKGAVHSLNNYIHIPTIRSYSVLHFQKFIVVLLKNIM